MRRMSMIVFILSALATVAAAEERFIVRLADGDEAPEALFQRLGFDVQRRLSADGELLCVVSSDALPLNVVEALFRAEPSVRGVEAVHRAGMAEVEEGDAREESYSLARRRGLGAALQNVIARLRGPEENPWSTAYEQQVASWGLSLRRIHRRYGGGAGVVAFIDTGVDPGHPRLGSRLVSGHDFLRDRSGIPSEWDDLDDETARSLESATRALVQQSTVAVLSGWEPAVVNQSTVAVLDEETAELLGTPAYQAFGHGTMVAGLVHLIAPGAHLMPLKAFGPDGSGDTAAIAEAIYYAVDHGADVINMSFSFEHFSMEVMRALNYATREGVVTVAAVGNRGESVLVFPAAFANVPGVGGLSLEGQRSPISNHGADLVSVAAPGEELVTTYPGAHYAVGFGTSFSAALVSGTVALMLDVDPDLRPDEVDRALALGRESRGELGYGPLDLEGALEWVWRNRGGR